MHVRERAAPRSAQPSSAKKGTREGKACEVGSKRNNG